LRIVGALTKPIRLATIRPLLEEYREPDPDEWAVEIRAGLDATQFSVHYQPKVAAADGRVLGFEALARWTHPTRGFVSPDRFIPLAEATGLIGPLTEYVLARAIADCARWTEAGFGCSVAVNIAAPILGSSSIFDRLVQRLGEHALPASSVTFEVTESAAMQRPHEAMAMLGRLRLRGVSLSLDDFGTGFSNLVLLHQLPFNVLKIDRRFVMDAASNQDSQVIVRTILGLALSLGLTTVAEGVETADVWQCLRTLGVDQVQGYGIARPMPSDQVAAWLRSYAPPELPGTDLGIA
jgi:EAL domain-containing protein (putative c-di-GMP-specific phosphodiesterase class I)